MALLDRLIRDARQAMKLRGHLPLAAERWVESSTNRSGATLHCGKCHKEAQVICKPQPNEIQIGGEAVAVSCNVATTNERLDKFVAQADEIRMDAVMGC
jgi:hypothetical protein